VRRACAFEEVTSAALAARCGGAFPPVSLRGAFQQPNAALAVALVEAFLERAPGLRAVAAAAARAGGASTRPPPPLPRGQHFLRRKGPRGTRRRLRR
jgi:hypothetical protein